MKDPALESFCDRVEHEFFQLKGRSGSLSSADFARARGWYESSWPLAAVVEGMREAFRSADVGRHAGVEEVNSLAFCESFVERAVRARRGAPSRR